MKDICKYNHLQFAAKRNSIIDARSMMSMHWLSYRRKSSGMRQLHRLWPASDSIVIANVDIFS
ncbi:(Csu525(RpL17)), mRNA [Zea mays]|uniref:(Csu525(RpL17)), mRNA n=1 Tax=Zea mays TaxID=4577 RepID=A0A1D6QB11_MAIZE|nr:(Csu525(RpL17)), mRNA [Zea mays]